MLQIPQSEQKDRIWLPKTDQFTFCEVRLHWWQVYSRRSQSNGCMVNSWSLSWPVYALRLINPCLLPDARLKPRSQRSIRLNATSRVDLNRVMWSPLTIWSVSTQNWWWEHFRSFTRWVGLSCRRLAWSITPNPPPDPLGSTPIRI